MVSHTANVFYCSFVAVVWTHATKEPTVKQKFVLLQFYVILL